VDFIEVGVAKPAIFFIGNTERKRPFERHRLRLENIIKIDLKR
jgi:hypothetical protein